MKKILPFIIVFLIWRIGLFLISYFADSVLIYAPTFPYFDTTQLEFGLPKWLYTWSNFDGIHYIRLIQYGYHGDWYIQAFFPLFPILISLISFVTQNHMLSGLLIANISFLFLLGVWYVFLKERYNSRIATFATLFLMIFPTAFYFGAIYTESFFLLVVLLAFYFAEKKEYYKTAFFILCATATKVVGIALVPALLFETFFGKYNYTELLHVIKKNKKDIQFVNKIKPTLLILLGSFGLLFYMYYLYKEFGDPLFFFHVQSEFGGGVRQETLVTYPQVVFRYIKILVTARPFDFKYFSYVQELVVGIAGLLAILYSVKKVRLSYIIFSLFAFLLPTLTGTFSSMPRYVLVCFPIFIVLATWAEKSTIFRYTWVIVSSILFVLNTILFIQGYWVA